MEKTMIDKKTGVWLAASAAVVLVVAGAVAVASTDWGAAPGSGEQARTAETASATPGRRGYRGSSSLFLLKFDADRDGRITRAEVDAGILAQFQGIDSNHDGRLDAAEYQVYDDARRAARKAWRTAHPNGDAGSEPDDRASNWDPMKRLDWNRDGFISLEEFGGRERALAIRADRDGDGTILVEDLMKPPRDRRTASTQ
jgi:hypothetical protein